MDLYKNPKYYEIAFGFRNIPREVDFFESVIKKFSKIKVKKVFELASGNSPYLEEWHKRGYRYYGLDLNPEMIDFTKKKARERNIEIKLFKGDINNFSLNGLKIDLAYVLLGSFYLISNEAFF
jgi:ubiquinone/menaquinone biosynthesis C-methylase UbiE